VHYSCTRRKKKLERSMVSQINEETKDGHNVSRIERVCPALLDLLTADGGSARDTLFQLLDSSHDSSRIAPTADSDVPWYWQQVHLKLTLQILVARTSSELANAVVKNNALKPNNSNNETDPAASSSVPVQLSQRLHLFRDLLLQLEAKIRAAEEEEYSDVSSDQPNRYSHAQLFAQVCLAYQLRPVEKRVLQFLITAKIQPATCAMFLLLPATMDYYSSLPGSGHGGDESMAFLSSTIRYASGGTALDWKTLANDDHVLCKDRVLIVEQEEYSEVSKLTVSSEAVKAFLFWTMTSEDKLKLAGTKLLDLVQDNNETGCEDNSAVPPSNKQQSARVSELDTDANVEDILSKLQGSITPSIDADDVGDDKYDAVLMAEFNDANDGDQMKESAPLVSSQEKEDAQGGDDEEDHTKPVAFENELDYLHQYFEIAMHKVALSRQRTAQDLKNASLNDMKPSWMRSGNEKSVKQRSVGEISAKLRLSTRKMELSLALTRQQGAFYPRLELLAEQLQLDDFQKFVLVYLAGSMISPVFKSCIQGDDSFTSSDKNAKVGDLLVAYFGTFSEQVAARPYFYKSSLLLKKGIVKTIKDFSAPPDLTDQQVRLDRRVLDTIVGLDKESSEISQGSHLFEPKVSLDSVVLPDMLKETIAGSVAHFETFRAYRKHHPDFDEAISYGVGLTLMFCGKSGTGKTMTANAIAAKLGKKLLLVNFPLLNQQNGRDDNHETKFQSIFREAELSDAIIFFDECESLFSKRSSGGSSETTELLTELERFEGIVFLATNHPFDLDEAMYRRINEVFEFKPPNYLERLQIWKLVTSHKAVPCGPNIDWESIALKYELTGGFIKNAVISALLDGVGRNPNSPQITEQDILNGCKKQVRGVLQMLDFHERVIPKNGLSDLIVSETVMEKLTEMVSLEKARGILFGTWGFDESMRARQGTTALFWGPSGTGRSRSAEAIGFELGKPLKVVDLPRLLTGSKGDGSNGNSENDAVRTVFQVRLQSLLNLI